LLQIWALAMPDYFKVVSGTGEYSVEIAKGCSTNALSGQDQARTIVLCDSYFALKYQELGWRTVAINSSESAKSLENMAEIIVTMRSMHADRTTDIVAIGGGVVQDIATFVSSVYMRGLTWRYVPTTLLGMVDSCLGGKSSINVGRYKNLVGNFYPPQSIFVDAEFIESLNTVQRSAGLCEAVKICFAHTGNAFEEFCQLNPMVSSSLDKYESIISLCLRTKQWFIEVDEFDHKERLLLNFGHTFGHAIEGASNFEVPHGIAVGIGMLAAVSFARSHTKLEPNQIRVKQLETYVSTLFKEVDELSKWVDHINLEQLLDRFGSDKKHNNKHYVVIIPNSEGLLERIEIEKNSSNDALLKESFLSAIAACR
jgi:3-dehydroquinate synthase